MAVPRLMGCLVYTPCCSNCLVWSRVWVGLPACAHACSSLAVYPPRVGQPCTGTQPHPSRPRGQPCVWHHEAVLSLHLAPAGSPRTCAAVPRSLHTLSGQGGHTCRPCSVLPAPHSPGWRPHGSTQQCPVCPLSPLRKSCRQVPQHFASVTLSAGARAPHWRTGAPHCLFTLNRVALQVGTAALCWRCLPSRQGSPTCSPVGTPRSTLPHA